MRLQFRRSHSQVGVIGEPISVGRQFPDEALSVWNSWCGVLHIGIPSGLTDLLMPVASAIITRILASYGEAAVAACGAAGRVKIFAFMIPIALGISQVPFIGQNWGAGCTTG